MGRNDTATSAIRSDHARHGARTGEIRMATKAKESEAVVEERPETQDGPLLDLSDDAVKKMIKAAKKRGFVTMDKLNSVLTADDVTSEQIEDTMAMLNDMGINVVEEEESEDAEEKESE